MKIGMGDVLFSEVVDAVIVLSHQRPDLHLPMQLTIDRARAQDHGQDRHHSPYPCPFTPVHHAYTLYTR